MFSIKDANKKPEKTDFRIELNNFAVLVKMPKKLQRKNILNKYLYQQISGISDGEVRMSPNIIDLGLAMADYVIDFFGCEDDIKVDDFKVYLLKYTEEAFSFGASCLGQLQGTQEVEEEEKEKERKNS